MRLNGFRLVIIIICFSLGCSILCLCQTTTLYVTKSGNDVILTFSGTAGPWRVVRSESVHFDYANALLNSTNSSGTEIDAGAAGDWKNYFYDVTDTGIGEPPADEGQPTEDIVKITSLVLDYGFDGDTITINGSGFDSNPASNQVFFGPLLAVVTGGTATSLTVTVPPDVTSCDVLVHKGSLTSNSLSFWSVLASNVSGTPFQDISSLCFNDRTGTTAYKHLFITDRGTNGITSDRLWEVQDNYTLIQRGGTWNEMKGLPMDVSGNMYFANTLNVSTNVGNVRKYDPVTLTHALWHHARLVSETDNVQVISIQMRSDGKGYAYNLSTGTWRIIDAVANTVFTYGSGAWFADDLMGSAIDSVDNLYFTSGGSIIKMDRVDVGPPYNPTITTVASAFVQGSGMDIDETTGNKLLLVADRGNGSAGNGKVYLLNAETGDMDLITSNLTNPRAVAFGEDKVTGELYYYIAEPTRVIRMPDPRIKLDDAVKKGNVKVLISKKGTGDSYPTPLQTADAQIKIPFEVEGKITGSVTVYPYLVDPKDESPYVTGAINDNKDPDKNGTSPGFQNLITPSSITVDASNRKGTFTLSITNQYAGDNYQLYLYLNSVPPDKPKHSHAKTGIFTAWKRLYVERDKMYRRGGLLAASFDPSTCAPNCNQIQLFDWTNVAVNDQVIVFDSQNTAESGGETVTITAISAPSGGKVTVTLNNNLTKAYTASVDPTGILDFSYGKSAGVGVIGSGFYESALSDLKQPFNEAYVEFIQPDTGMNGVPYIDRQNIINQNAGIPSNNVRTYFHVIWTQTGAQDQSNKIQFIGATGYTYQVPPGGNLLGVTDPSNNYCYIYRQLLSDMYTEPVLTNAVLAVDDHEMAHQFHTNRCASDPHDTRMAWCSGSSCSGEPCLNQAGDGSNFNDSINKMCV